LLRFGSELIFSLCEHFGTEIVIINRTEDSSFEEDLAVESKIGNFERNINRLPEFGAKTWHFYRQDYRWVVAVQFTPALVERVSRSIQYGCIGIDLNLGSIGWAYVDLEGYLILDMLLIPFPFFQFFLRQ
jgi:hypothetical protein